MAASQVVLPITRAEIMDEMWHEASRGCATVPPMSQAAHLAAQHDGPQSNPLAPLPLPVLLSLDGTAFVQAAYATVLHRAPDEVGTAHILAELSAGCSKIVVIGRLRNSAEGQQVGAHLPGLSARYRAHRFYAMPLVGPVARVGAAAVRRTGVWRLAGARPQSSARAVEQAEPPVPEPPTAQIVEDEVRRQLADVTAPYDRKLEAMAGQMRSFPRRISAMEDSVTASLLAMADSLAHHDARLGKLEQVDTRVEQVRQELADQQRRISLMLETLRSRPDTPLSASDEAALEAQDEHALDSLYVAFEDRFRGSRADIKQRQRFYLPILAEAGAGTTGRAIVDVGCGRGEFLELMRDEGLIARGVDANETMVEVCQAAGLESVAGDALAYLAQQEPNSLGAVTGFHIIEHLPFKVMVRLFDEAFRALAPGGVMVFETPNPANLMVASRWFYLDPTHRNPLPGEMVSMIAEVRGFTRVSILDLHPAPQRFSGGDPVLREELDRIFYGPQDYALLARKP